MKLDRNLLLASAREALDKHRARWEREQAELRAQRDQDAALWVARYGDEWRAFSRRITAALRKGQPITADMYPSVQYRSDASSFRTRPRLQEKYTPPADLATLVTALEVTKEGELTMNALRSLGISPGVLGQALRHITAERRADEED